MPERGSTNAPVSLAKLHAGSERSPSSRGACSVWTTRREGRSSGSSQSCATETAAVEAPFWACCSAETCRGTGVGGSALPPHWQRDSRQPRASAPARRALSVGTCVETSFAACAWIFSSPCRRSSFEARSSRERRPLRARRLPLPRGNRPGWPSWGCARARPS